VDLHEALISLNTERDNWFKGIETKYPEYYSFKHGYWNKSLEELKKEKIKEDELLIDYVQFDSLFYVISVSKEKELSRAFIMDSTFISQLSMFKFNSDLKDLSKTDEVLNVLYKLLIRDEIEFHGPSIQKITISTDSNLSAFPFEILLADDYLVKKYDFRYIHSVDFNYKHFGKPKKPIGVFAPQYNALKAIDVSYNQPLAMLVRDGEWMLPGAQEESAMIASLFDGEIFTGGLSSLSNFILEAPNYRSLHLSMHTIASDSVKSGFALVFPNESISTDFDLLKDNDIYDLKLNAEMVVLSACNTGKGTYKKGIGVKSLANSFFYAGVPSTVMSFWKVPDEQTSIIMINFYENLKKGNSKSNALRNAKIDYLNNVQTDELKHPYYWSGFVLIGNDDPIDLSNKAMLYKYLGLFIFLIIATYLIFFKRK
jgi:CHAT domain-containing protein